MRRTQNANMQEVRRLINLLLKTKRYARQMEGTPVGTPALQLLKRYERQMEASGKKAALHYVPEIKGVSGLESECPKDLSGSNENG